MTLLPNLYKSNLLITPIGYKNSSTSKHG